jgi:three-Cys-motif partner protein
VLFGGCVNNVFCLAKQPFSEETITKLDIFEKYLESWLPVAIQSRFITEVNICDFFAGIGRDIKGIDGSPIRIIKTIKKFEDTILKQNLKIHILFNEYIPAKYQQLCDCISKEQETLKNLDNNLSIEIVNQDFKELFVSKKPLLENHFNLVFLDQSGIKQITEDVFLNLIKFTRTDFMFFISSSVFKRFATDTSFQKYFPDIDIQELSKTRQNEMHRLIFQYYKSKIPNDSQIKLYPFTIKKGRNIYGLIFGSNHPLGVEKFLNIAWNANELNGEANFDIDEDWKSDQMLLFGERKLSKIEKFQLELEEFILSKKAVLNKEVYDFALENGHIIKNTLPVIKKLENKISYTGHHNISYNKCYKNKEIKEYKVL